MHNSSYEGPKEPKESTVPILPPIIQATKTDYSLEEIEEVPGMPDPKSESEPIDP